MTFPKLLLPILAAACLGGCVYEEYDTGYQEPPRVYHGGYVRRDVVVERRAPRYYDDRPRGYVYGERDPYYDSHPRSYYDRRPQPYVNTVVVHDRHNKHYESADERRRREIRESQRRAEDRGHDKKKDDDKKKKRKKKDD